MVGSRQHGAVSLFTRPYGCNCGCAATRWLLTVRSPGVYRLRTPTNKGGVMCKALAGSGRVTGQVYCRLRLALRHRWSKWLGSLAHHVALRWVTRAFRRRLDSHVDVVRRRGRRSGARVSGRLLHANPKIGLCLRASSMPNYMIQI
eukprot:scaffold12131_cov112-Isochrysis_galbana.AAC.5